MHIGFFIHTSSLTRFTKSDTDKQIKPQEITLDIIILDSYTRDDNLDNYE